ncbi:MAG TPA: hypothetical protein VF401_04565 [Candidatus Saccharimonadales bacterium]
METIRNEAAQTLEAHIKAQRITAAEIALERTEQIDQIEPSSVRVVAAGIAKRRQSASQGLTEVGEA